MNLQFIIDKKGHKSAVQLPMKVVKLSPPGEKDHLEKF